MLKESQRDRLKKKRQKSFICQFTLQMVTKASVGQAEARIQEPKANHVSGRVSDIRPFSFASPKVLAGRQIRSRIDRTGLGYPCGMPAAQVWVFTHCSTGLVRRYISFLTRCLH